MRRIRRPSRRQRGYSLVELMIALPMATLLMAGLAASVHLAGRSIPSETNLASATLAAGNGLELFAQELQYAAIVNTRTTTVVEFTLPDRNGDASGETIRYQWSGTAGAPLTRQINGSTSEIVVAEVNQFAVNYYTRSQNVGGTMTYYLTSADIKVHAKAGRISFDTTVALLNEPSTSGP
jgi:Tfp pilus assembly protein PilW